MPQRLGKLLRTSMLLATCAGCASGGVWSSARLMPWKRRDAVEAAATSAIASDAASTAVSSKAQTNEAAAQPGSAAAASTMPAADRNEMLALVGQLKESGAIDQETQDRLLEDLAKTDPTLWPQMLDVFRASLAYRQKYVDPQRRGQVAGSDSPGREPQRVASLNAPIETSSVAPAIATDQGPRATAPTATAATQPGNTTAPQTAAPQAAPPQSGAPQDAGAKVIPTAAAPAAPEAANARTESSSPANPGQTPASAAAAKAPGEILAASATAAALADPSATAASPSANPGVTAAPPAAEAEPQHLDWHDHLEAAIAGLENETSDPPGTTAAIGRHAGLRLLYLVDGRRDSALKPIAGIPPTQQDFWTKEMFALVTYLDAERNADESRRAAAASVPLREAAAKLGELATLSVRSLAFCNEVSSYGVYKKFPKYEFQAGQEVLLYAEVENFKTLANEKGFHTSLKSSYEILDNHGARVDQKEFEITAEDCQNPRRDYFIRYFVWLPKRIYGGTYTLQLTIEDTHSQKIGQSSIEFTIHEKDN